MYTRSTQAVHMQYTRSTTRRRRLTRLLLHPLRLLLPLGPLLLLGPPLPLRLGPRRLPRALLPLPLLLLKQQCLLPLDDLRLLMRSLWGRQYVSCCQ